MMMPGPYPSQSQHVGTSSQHLATTGLSSLEEKSRFTTSVFAHMQGNDERLVLPGIQATPLSHHTMRPQGLYTTLIIPFTSLDLNLNLSSPHPPPPSPFTHTLSSGLSLAIRLSPRTDVSRGGLYHPRIHPRCYQHHSRLPRNSCEGHTYPCRERCNSGREESS